MIDPETALWMKIDELTAENKRLREALKEFGRHPLWCLKQSISAETRQRGVCNCGLRRALGKGICALLLLSLSACAPAVGVAPNQGDFVVLYEATGLTVIEHKPTGLCFIESRLGGLAVVPGAVCQTYHGNKR